MISGTEELKETSCVNTLQLVCAGVCARVCLCTTKPIYPMGNIFARSAGTVGNVLV